MAIGAILGVIVVILLVIGVVYFKIKSSKKKIDVLDEKKRYTIATEHEQTSSDSWMTTSNVHLQLDNSRPETPVDMLVQSPPQSHHTTNYKPKFDPIQLSHKQL